MPTVEFVANVLGRAKRVDVPDGGELVDVCDHVYAPIPFSCRSATCATCYIEVMEGIELLVPPEPAEQELLDLLGRFANRRLACQTRIRPGAGLIRIKPAGA